MRGYTLHDEAGTARLGQVLASCASPGCTLYLRGELGAGKSALARAFIRTLLGRDTEPVPSPTYTLVQSYETPLGPVLHFDLYRLNAAAELHELGYFSEAGSSIRLVEWPEILHAHGEDALTLRLSSPEATGRKAELGASGPLAARWLKALPETLPAPSSDKTTFLRAAGWEGAQLEYLAGDASNRFYERASLGGKRAALMNAPPDTNTDTPAFLALTNTLRGMGYSAPEILHANTGAGFVLLEDLGNNLFARLCHTQPSLETQLYEAAIDLLVNLHRQEAPEAAVFGQHYHLIPPYNDAVLRREASLLTDWWARAAEYPLSGEANEAYLDLVSEACAPFADETSTLVLRDYHAENLIWLPERTGHARVGLLDYQDALRGHAAYDVVSLLEDARRDVPPALAAAMKARYCACTGTDPGAFERAYATLGAQRNAKIVGIFTRLHLRDSKPHYLDLIPRVWAYLMQDLEHPHLRGLKSWIEAHIPPPTPETLDRIRARA